MTIGRVALVGPKSQQPFGRWRLGFQHRHHRVHPAFTVCQPELISEGFPMIFLATVDLPQNANDLFDHRNTARVVVVAVRISLDPRGESPHVQCPDVGVGQHEMRMVTEASGSQELAAFQ